MRTRNVPRAISLIRGKATADDWEEGESSGSRKRAGGGVLLSKVLRGAFAVLLAVGMLPLVPGAPAVKEAEALEGTTNYGDFFVIGHRDGSPGSISGNVLLGSATDYSWQYEYRANRWASSSVFMSKRPVSLLHDWEVRVRGNLAEPAGTVAGSTANNMFSNLQIGLTSNSNPSQTTGMAGVVARNWVRGSGKTAEAKIMNMSGGTATTPLAGPSTITSADSYDIVLRYTASSKRLTFSAAGKTLSYGVKAALGSNPYLFIQTTIGWANNSTTVADPPRGVKSTIQFQSLTLPHLEPVIEGVGLYREDGTAIGKDDIVSPGEKVQVRCTVRNAYAYPGSEQYPMHVKLANTAANPTQGLVPFADASHPLQVNGTTVATAPGPDTVTGANGVPITLTGANPTTVSYWATITGVSGGAVMLSQELIEDAFQGRKYATVELVAEQSLRPLPDDADPNDPSSWGTPGTDYHYTRLPQPNANGWNTTPVAVQFFGGDFDSLTVAPANGDAAVSLADRQTWTRADDTDGYGVQISAANSETGDVSSERDDIIKIDTSAPRLSLDPALGALTVDDRPSDPSKATSGVWRLHRTGADGSVSSGRAAPQEFPLTNGAGAPTQTVANIANGYYVAEDAAGNLSAVLKVGSTEPPAVERPSGSIVDPGDPNPPTPVGPPVGPGDNVPDPAVTEDADGLRHAVINETVTEMIDPAAPPFGGLLESAEATALMDYRYAASSTAAPLAVSDALLDADGNPLASFDTKVPGECLIRRVITDAQGNTTTINLRYQTVRDNCPPVRPLQPSDPSDPDSPKVPGDPLSPSGPVTEDPDGTQHAEVDCEVTEATGPGTMDASGALALLERHYDMGTAKLTVRSLQDAAGASVPTIDLSRPANYLITYVASDAQGNTTTVRLTYHLVESKAPEVKPKPDPSHPDPKPLEPPTPPHIHPDGTHHATVYDTVRTPTQPGASLSLDAVRALMEGRYTFAATGGGTTTERSLVLTNAAGSAVGSIDLSREGTYHIAYTRADAAGNTTTVNLTYVVFRDQCPLIRPLEPVDPADPGGDKKPGDPLRPNGPVTEDPDGGQHVEVTCEVVEVVTHGVMDKVGAQALLRRHFLPTDVDGGKDVAVTVQSMKNAAGDAISAIDLSRVASYQIVYLVSDGDGNSTTVRMTYRLEPSRLPGVIKHPDPGTEPNPLPGDDPLNPQPRPIDPATPPRIDEDGTQHAVIEDEMHVPVKAGAQLTLADARSLMDRRYTFTPEGGGTVTELKLALADAAGNPASAINLARPGSWMITYQVADAGGNTITVHLRYVVTSRSPSLTPSDPDGSGGPTDPDGPAGSGGPSGSGPLEPSEVTVDPETGLTHSVVKDHVVVGISDEPMTPQAMAAFIDDRYELASALGDAVTAGEVHLFNGKHAPVAVIDRSVPGVWLADQTMADSFGNTTTLNLTYEVRSNTAGGSLDDTGNGSGDGNGGAGAGDGSGSGSGAGDGSGSDGRWSSRIHALPQTGGIFGPCPLHILFVLMMLLVSAYTMMRLRQGKSDRNEVRREAV